MSGTAGLASNSAAGPAADADTRLAAAELHLLRQQIAAARVELRQLRTDLAEIGSQIDGSRGAQLLEANEQLVQAMLRAHSEAETNAIALEEASLSARIDALTGLPNRTLLLDRLAQAIALARRRGSRIALLFLDIDNFKQVNDLLGHGAGDSVLKMVAQRLLASVRLADTVSRLGGDEFVVVLTDCSGAADAARVAAKLGARLAAPALIAGKPMSVSASIGVSLFPDDGDDAATLLERADAAMYLAKRGGPGRPEGGMAVELPVLRPAAPPKA